jgi:hypothetical protein
MDRIGRSFLAPYPFTPAELARLVAYRGAIAAGLYTDRPPSRGSAEPGAAPPDRPAGSADAERSGPGATRQPWRTSRRGARPTSDKREP